MKKKEKDRKKEKQKKDKIKKEQKQLNKKKKKLNPRRRKGSLQLQDYHIIVSSLVCLKAQKAKSHKDALPS